MATRSDLHSDSMFVFSLHVVDVPGHSGHGVYGLLHHLVALLVWAKVLRDFLENRSGTVTIDDLAEDAAGNKCNHSSKQRNPLVVAFPTHRRDVRRAVAKITLLRLLYRVIALRPASDILKELNAT